MQLLRVVSAEEMLPLPQAGSFGGFCVLVVIFTPGARDRQGSAVCTTDKTRVQINLWVIADSPFLMDLKSVQECQMADIYIPFSVYPASIENV